MAATSNPLPHALFDPDDSIGRNPKITWGKDDPQPLHFIFG